MKILYVYYSMDGNCRALVKHMAGTTGGDIQELKPAAEKVPAHGVGKYLVGGRMALLGETSKLEPLVKQPRNYDLTVVGTPVWFWRMTPPVRGFLAGRDWAGGKVALFALFRGSAGFALSGMAKLVRHGGGAVVSSEGFRDLGWGDANATLSRASAWQKRLVSELQTTTPAL